MSLRRHAFHRVLHRPSLFLGGEREPVLMTAIIAGALAVTGMNTLPSSSPRCCGSAASAFPRDGEGRSADEQGLSAAAQVSRLLPGALAPLPDGIARARAQDVPRQGCRVPDLLNWAALVEDGIVQGKDGSARRLFLPRRPTSPAAPMPSVTG